jgi:hypothetical protein
MGNGYNRKTTVPAAGKTERLQLLKMASELKFLTRRSPADLQSIHFFVTKPLDIKCP